MSGNSLAQPRLAIIASGRRSHAIFSNRHHREENTLYLLLSLSRSRPHLPLILSLTVILLAITTVSPMAGSYIVAPGSVDNTIHLELIQPDETVIDFSADITTHPDWFELSSITVNNNRLAEIVVQFNITSSPQISSSGKVVFAISPLDQNGNTITTIKRTLHLTVAPEAPVIQRDYTIEECCIHVSTSEDPVPVIPATTILLGNTPNPFHSLTQIRFGLPGAESVSLRICDVSGRCLRHITTEQLSAGYHQDDRETMLPGDNTADADLPVPCCSNRHRLVNRHI